MAAINQLRYSQQYEKLRAQGLSHDEAHWRAVQFATVETAKPKKKKESRIKRLARLTKMAALGKHYKVPKKTKPKPKKAVEKRAPKKKRTAAYPLVEYAKQTGRPKLKGATGADLEEIRKILRMKKKKK